MRKMPFAPGEYYHILNRGNNKQITLKTVNAITETRCVALINFSLMPNHFHLTVYEEKERGISQYMQRILNAYTKYFNTKYERAGHLFQGPFKAVHAKTNEQLIYLSAYIHLNPREIKEWKDKEKNYTWSSYQDYIGKNRWDGLLKPDIIMDQFNTKQEYEHFVKTSGAKKLEEELDLE